MNALTTRWPSITASEKYETTMKLKSNDSKSMSLGELFEYLEQIKKQDIISTYTVNQTTLQQIFQLETDIAIYLLK